MPSVRTRVAVGFCGLALGLGLPGVQPARAAEWANCQVLQPAAGRLRPCGTEKIDNLRDSRYVEIDLYAKDALKKLLYVSIYNTTGLNGADNSATRRRRR